MSPAAAPSNFSPFRALSSGLVQSVRASRPLPNGPAAPKTPSRRLVPFAGRSAMAQDHFAGGKSEVRILQRIVVFRRNSEAIRKGDRLPGSRRSSFLGPGPRILSPFRIASQRTEGRPYAARASGHVDSGRRPRAFERGLQHVGTFAMLADEPGCPHGARGARMPIPTGLEAGGPVLVAPEQPGMMGPIMTAPPAPPPPGQQTVPMGPPPRIVPIPATTVPWQGQ
jgi:hypothetical protein